MMPNFQPAPHECDLPAPEGATSDFEGGASLSRGPCPENALERLTGAPSCKVHGPGKHIAPDGPGKNRPWVCLECMNEENQPWLVTIRELRAEIAALKATKRPGGPLKPLGEMIKIPSEVDQLKADLDTALEYVEDAVNQACQMTLPSGEIVLDTTCNRAWESVCDYLHRFGRVSEKVKGRLYLFPWMIEHNAKRATKGADNG